jgi:iron complex outermembrane receptor protein
MALAALRVTVSAARAEEAALPSQAPFTTTVTAPPSAPATPREDRAAAASVVVPSESPRAFEDLGTLLLQVPGVTVVRTGSNMEFATLTLRGSNPDQVMVYVDGVLLNVAEGGGVDLSTLPLGDVERVEVYRGTTPLVFGESALGGVVSITTRTPNTSRQEARAGVGSYGTWFGDATASGRLGRLRLYAGVHAGASKGDYPYLNQNGTAYNLGDDAIQHRANNDLGEVNGTLRAALTLTGRRTLTLGLVGFGREQGLPGPVIQLQSVTIFSRFHTGRGLGYLRYESRDDLGPGGRLSAEVFSSLEWDRLIDPGGEVYGRPILAHATTLSTGATAHGSRPLGEWGRAAAMLEGRREVYAPVNETTPAMSGGTGRRAVGVAGAELDLRVRPLDLDLIPSARVELMGDAVGGINTAGRPVPTAPAIFRALPVYRLGLVRTLGEAATFKANVGRYERAPSFLELYGNGNAFLLGNPTLRPERGTNADLALWIDRAGPRAAVSSRTTLFGAVAENLIDWQRTTTGPSRAANIGSARVYGLEQEATLAAGRHFKLIGQGTVTVALDESDQVASHGKQLPNHPRYTVYGRPEVGHLALPAGLDLTLYADAAVFLQDYADRAQVTKVPTQVFVGAGASLLWPRARLRVTASALNLGDQRTWDLRYWPLPGRTLFLALAYDSTGAEGGAGLEPSFGNPW